MSNDAPTETTESLEIRWQREPVFSFVDARGIGIDIYADGRVRGAGVGCFEQPVAIVNNIQLMMENVRDRTKAVYGFLARTGAAPLEAGDA